MLTPVQFVEQAYAELVLYLSVHQCKHFSLVLQYYNDFNAKKQANCCPQQPAENSLKQQLQQGVKNH